MPFRNEIGGNTSYNNEIHGNNKSHREHVALLDRLRTELKADVMLTCRDVERTQQVVDTEMIDLLSIDECLPTMWVVDLTKYNGTILRRL